MCSVCYYDMITYQSQIMIYDSFHIHSHKANWWINEMYLTIWPRWPFPAPVTPTSPPQAPPASSHYLIQYLTQVYVGCLQFFSNLQRLKMKVTCLFIIYEEAVIGMISPNSYPFHYFLWAHHILFLPTFPRKQLQHKIRAICTLTVLSLALVSARKHSSSPNCITYHFYLNIIWNCK